MSSRYIVSLTSHVGNYKGTIRLKNDQENAPINK